MLLRELTEEVALVFVRVATCQERIDLLAIDDALLLAAVVTCCHRLGSKLESLFEEYVELNLAVAKHIGVGGTSLLVLREHIIDHALAVLLRQIDIVEGDIQALCHQLGKYLVVVPRTLALELTRCIVPITHK